MTGLSCPSCGEENPPRFRFCGYCGSALVAVGGREARKVVTAIFSDLKGSTNLAESLDSESLREVITRYFAVMREIIERHGGTVENLVGDAILAVFGLRTAHEDDPLRAVQAAAEMKSALVTLNRELARTWGVTLTNRTGISTGEVVARDPGAGQRLVIGDAVNTAARLEQACPPTEILVGGDTYEHVRSAIEVEALEPLSLKGKAEPVPAYRLVSVRDRPVDTREDLPLIGRDEELATVVAALDEASRSRACRVVTLVGDAGVGKSRLVAEAAAAARARARVVTGRCLPYGRGITFWPLVEIAGEAAGIADDDPPDVAMGKLAALAGDFDVAARIGSAIGLVDDQFPVDEIFWAARRLFERMAEQQPLMVVLEDVHWAEPTFLELVDHLRESAAAPLLVLCPARPELLDARPQWGTGPRSERLLLEPLSEGDCVRVVVRLLGGATLAPEVLERILEAASGNPLYIEQLLSMLVDDGSLRFTDGRWQPVGDLDDLSIPASIHALVTARLDCLHHEERAVVDPASVVGMVFAEEAVQDLVGAELRAQVPVRLSSLAAKRFVDPIADHPIVDEGYAFQHVVIRETVYRGLLKRQRAHLHERFVEWSEGHGAGRARDAEFDEILGWHLEQAHRCLSELGPLDRHGRGLGERGARRLAAAGRRAFARGDMPAAAGLLRRASRLLQANDPARLALLTEAGEALMELGEFAPAEAFLQEAGERAAAVGDARVGARAALIGLLLRGHVSEEPEGVAEPVVEEAERAIPVFQAARDEEGLAMAYRLQAWAHGTLCRYGRAAAAAQRALTHARRAGDHRQGRRAAAQYAVAALYGPTPVPEAVAHCERIIEESSTDRRTAGLVMSVLSRLVAMQGDVARARRLSGQARAILEEMGRSVVSCSTSLDSCGVEMLAGDPAAAERDLRRDHAALTEMGERYLLSTIAAELARAVEAQGRSAEAADLTATAEELTAEDDVASQALWRSVRAKVLARAGSHREAALLAHQAVEVLGAADASITKADALVDLAEVLALGDDPAGSADALAAALALMERKGNALGADVARARLRGLATATAA